MRWRLVQVFQPDLTPRARRIGAATEIFAWSKPFFLWNLLSSPYPVVWHSFHFQRANKKHCLQFDQIEVRWKRCLCDFYSLQNKNSRPRNCDARRLARYYHTRGDPSHLSDALPVTTLDPCGYITSSTIFSLPCGAYEEPCHLRPSWHHPYQMS